MSLRFPVDEIIPALSHALEQHNVAILEAAPGAGKSTRVPLALLNSDEGRSGRIFLLEPRRLAARAIATFLAAQLGEPVGKTVGYRTRTDSKVSKETRLVVATEGILTRMALADPELNGIDLVIFDEFHERSLQADLGLALVSEIREAFRPDLRVLVMSATLDGLALNEVLSAPVIRSEGKCFSVDVRYCPPQRGEDWQSHCANQVLHCLPESQVILVFLPGRREILALDKLLSGKTGNRPVEHLYGGLTLEQQTHVLSRAEKGESLIILTTNVAETSLTVAGVSHVVDAGWVREMHYDPARHRSRLVTRRVSRASATQRSGRAGRLRTGTAIRLWSEQEVLAEHATPEIERTGLDSLVLDLARWGCREPGSLLWLNSPPIPAWQSAVKRLQLSGALDMHACLTPIGERIAAMGLEPALASLILIGERLGHASLACTLAAMLSDSGGQLNNMEDVRERLDAIRTEPRRYRDVQFDIQRLHKQLHIPVLTTQADDDAVMQVLAHAFPYQLAKRREGKPGLFQMVDGPGVRFFHRNGALANKAWILVLDTNGEPRDALIRLALPIDDAIVQEIIDQHGQPTEQVRWDSGLKRVVGREGVAFGSLLLNEKNMGNLSAAQYAEGLLDAFKQQGACVLPWDTRCEQWCARVTLLTQQLASQEEAETWPKVDAESLRKTSEAWLLPYLAGVRSFEQWGADNLWQALQGMLSAEQQQQLSQQMPEQIKIPTGQNVSLVYETDKVVLSTKLQALFGLQQLPRLALGKLPITVHLLTPAGRPAAITDNLARFWQEGYPEVRKALRGRYPKHPWPEDPLAAQATHFTKARARAKDKR